MKALAEIQVIPIGSGLSVRDEMMRAHEIIKAAGLKVQLHAYGTNVDLGGILSLIEQIREKFHEQGTMRPSTNVKLGTRRDKEPTLEDTTRALEETLIGSSHASS